jgi:hypothetical protein
MLTEAVGVRDAGIGRILTKRQIDERTIASVASGCEEMRICHLIDTSEGSTKYR